MILLLIIVSYVLYVLVMLLLVMHRVLKTRPKTRHPTILVRPKPEPDFQNETRTHPNPTVKPDKTRRVFVWLENSNFDPKSSKFSKKIPPKFFFVCVLHNLKALLCEIFYKLH